MNAVAASLSSDEIDALATFFNQQSTDTSKAQGDANKGTISSILKNNPLTFPKNFPSDYSLYTTVDRADNKQVRYLYLDNASMSTFKDKGNLPTNASIVMEIYKAKLNNDGDPVKGSDGFYQKESLAAYAAMKKERNWGENMPKEIRNGDWKYGFFKKNKEHNSARNMAKCMACHQPLSDQEFMFSFDSLKNSNQVRTK